jgi:hypothetical protein
MQEGTDLGRSGIEGLTKGFDGIAQAYQTRIQAVQIRHQHLVDGLRVTGFWPATYASSSARQA